jgi:hypothetical protein
MRKKSRGSVRWVELAIFGGLVVAALIALSFAVGMTSIAAFFSPAAPTSRPVVLAGSLPTPAPTVTRTPIAAPTAIATPVVVPTISTGQVLMTSYLRTDPRVADDTRQAILCPSDAVEYTAQRTVEDLVWYRVRLVQPAEDCTAGRAPAGAEGWASSNVLSPPSGSVVVDGP